MSIPQYDEELVTNSHGRQFWIYKNDKFYQQRIAGAGPFQKHNMVRLRTLKPNARTIIDVGANIGMNTIEYGTWGKVVESFEPTSQTFSMLERSVALAVAQGELPKNWWGSGSTRVTADIHLHKAALSSTTGTAEIVIKVDNAGHNHINNADLLDLKGNARVRRVTPLTEQIALQTLDSYNFSDVDLIKVDVEGHELSVLLGAEQTIIRNRPIVQLEIIEAQTCRYNYTAQMLYDWFLARDFYPTLSDGRFAGYKWHKFPKRIDRFFVHKSLLQPGDLDIIGFEDVEDSSPRNYVTTDVGMPNWPFN